VAILAAHAQENSLRVSESCKWRIQRMFREGRPNIGRMLGYRLFEGKFYIVPEEAELVRRIFAAYLAGKGKNAIARWLNQECVIAPRGGKWGESTVAGLLRNEKYAGNMLLQKTYIADHLTKQTCVNRGERPQFYVEQSHEAIIDPAVFDAVQAEIARRHLRWGRQSGLGEMLPRSISNPSVASLCPNKAMEKYPLTGLVKCGICGASYTRKHAAAGSKYEKIVWICPTYNMRGKDECGSQQIPEAILLAKVAEAGGFEGLTDIRVTGPGSLSFIYASANTAHPERQVDLTWQNPSRSQSWTPEMKEAARQRSLAAAQKRREQEAIP